MIRCIIHREFFMVQETEPNDQSQKINYSLNRLSIKIGWEF